MKTLLSSITLFAALLLSVSAADDKAQFTYEGDITGVVCVSCKEHVTAALKQKLPGVVSVDVKNTDSPDSKKLIVVSTDANVTKDAAVKALGSYAKNYNILSLAKKE
jgi:hypothetical protein